MKRVDDMKKSENADIRPEYDFSQGVQGKHHKGYTKGHTVRIRKADGTDEVQHFKLEEGAVLLAPDVREYFSDSDSVNQALRSLISLVPRKKRRTPTKSK